MGNSEKLRAFRESPIVNYSLLIVHYLIMTLELWETPRSSELSGNLRLFIVNANQGLN